MRHEGSHTHVDALLDDYIVDRVNDDEALLVILQRMLNNIQNLAAGMMPQHWNVPDTRMMHRLAALKRDRYHINIPRESAESKLLQQRRSRLIEVIQDQRERARIGAKTKHAVHEVQMVVLILSLGEGARHGVADGQGGLGAALLADAARVVVVALEPLLVVAGTDGGLGDLADERVAEVGVADFEEPGGDCLAVLAVDVAHVLWVLLEEGDIVAAKGDVFGLMSHVHWC